jgi:glycosyltransferase involved in cell wall biosynthesis
MPRVSIGIPAYARPRELARAIESVLSQGYRDFELVVGDDSGDLEPVVAPFDDPRLTYHRHEERLGMAGNWSFLLDNARGDLIGLLGDDDRLLPGYLEAVVSTFDRDPSLGVVFTDHYFDRDGELTQRECELPGGRHEPFLLPYLTHLPVPISATLMRRDVWEAIRPLPELKSSDVVMFLRAAEAGYAFHYVDEPLMAYRMSHPNQLSQQAAFRHDTVEVWELFEFADPAAEKLRRGHLARELVSRAALNLKEGKHDEALADLERADDLAPGSLGTRGRLVRSLARHPTLAPPALGLLRKTGLIAR